jgi:hypothetical protein
MSAGKLRTLLILSWWLIPLWFVLWYADDLEFEFGWALYWYVTPVSLALWAVLAILPFKLTTRLREIHHGLYGRQLQTTDPPQTTHCGHSAQLRR